MFKVTYWDSKPSMNGDKASCGFGWIWVLIDCRWKLLVASKNGDMHVYSCSDFKNEPENTGVIVISTEFVFLSYWIFKGFITNFKFFMIGYNIRRVDLTYHHGCFQMVKMAKHVIIGAYSSLDHHLHLVKLFITMTIM